MNIYKEKYGFVYIWFDRKNKRYYIGSHWGFEDDGYVCSSNWMYNSYKRRPDDFKRRILTRHYGTREALYEKEQYLLNMIQDHELATHQKTKSKRETVRYYNVSKVAILPWHAIDERRKSIGEKISKSKTGKNTGPRDPSVGENISKGQKEKFAKKQEELGYKFSPEHCENISKGQKGKSHTEEWKTENGKRVKEQWNNGTRKGKPHTEEWKANQSLRLKGKKLKSEQVEQLRENNYKAYTITFINDNIIIINGLKKYSQENNIPYTTLHKASVNSGQIKKYNIKSIALVNT